MKIAFVGKGGSGKTTVSTLFTKYLHQNGANVLAIDVDHNMDFMFNLGVEQMDNYLGDAMPDLLDYCGLGDGSDYRDALGKGKDEIIFKINPKDKFTKKYTKTLDDNLSLMAAGPHTEKIFSDEACSHILGTPLKVYLPYLNLGEDDFVILDEKAGADGVGTGISKGLDVAVLVVEPTKYGIKAAKQISAILDRFNIAYIYVINKLYEEAEIEAVTKEMGSEPSAIFYAGKEYSNVSEGSVTSIQSDSLKKLLQGLKDIVNKKE